MWNFNKPSVSFKSKKNVIFFSFFFFKKKHFSNITRKIHFKKIIFFYTILPSLPHVGKWLFHITLSLFPGNKKKLRKFFTFFYLQEETSDSIFQDFPLFFSLLSTSEYFLYRTTGTSGKKNPHRFSRGKKKKKKNARLNIFCPQKSDKPTNTVKWDGNPRRQSKASFVPSDIKKTLVISHPRSY